MKRTWHSAPMTGFTLIEILVVIAIIALVAGILLVTLAPAREKGRQATCISNLGQIHRALMMYSQDWGGVEAENARAYSDLGLPPPLNDASWLDAYLKNRAVWRCPSAVEPSLRTYVFHWMNLPPPPSGDVTHFAESLAQCGERTPLLHCPNHGARQGLNLYYVVLRWSGQVKGQYVRFPHTACFD